MVRGEPAHSISNWRRNSGFEDVRILQVIGNKSKGKNNSAAHSLMSIGELTLKFAGNRIKMTIIITASIYSVCVKRQTMPTES